MTLTMLGIIIATSTGAHAYGNYSLDTIELTQEQRDTLEEMHILRENGELTRKQAKAMLAEVNIDKKALREMRREMKKAHNEKREIVHAAIESGDFGDYQDLVAGTKHADLVTTEADFMKLQEAHDLRESGDKDKAREIMKELGFEMDKKHFNKKKSGGMKYSNR